VFLAHTDLRMIGTSLHADGRFPRLHADGPALVEDWTAQILKTFAPRFTMTPLPVTSMPAPACHGWRCPHRKVCPHGSKLFPCVSALSRWYLPRS